MTNTETARAAWRDWLKSERRLAGHTLVAYEHDVATFLGFMTAYLGDEPSLEALAKLKPAEFRAWLAERARQGLARSSTARALASVRSFFQFLDRRGLAHNASIGAIRTPKLPHSIPKALSEPDMADVLDAPQDREREAWLDLRDAAVLILLYGAGLRLGEALSLTKATVEELLASGRDTLSITGKGNKTRLVLLLPQALDALKAYRDACPWLAARKPGDIGFVSNVAEGVAMLVESLDWRPGDNVVLGRYLATGAEDNSGVEAEVRKEVLDLAGRFPIYS